MKVLSAFLLLAGLAVRASAYIYFLNTNWTGIIYEVDYGLKWVGDGTPVNISLMHGPIDNMQYVRNITVNNPSNAMLWNPSDVNPSGNYSLIIYQGPFSLSSPRFEMVGAVTRVPATMSVVVTITPSVMTASDVQISPSDLPRIVVEGRDVKADPVGTAGDRVARQLLSRQMPRNASTSGNSTAPASPASTVIQIAEAGVLSAPIGALLVTCLGLLVVL